MNQRKIVIVGMSFTGSTLTSTMFNCVPGVVGLGEVHWLIRKPTSGCNVCGPNCPIISKLDRKTLSWGNLQDKLLEATRANVLVSSDKDSSFIEPQMNKKEFDAIILFKRPEAFMASGLRHQRVWDPKDVPEAFAQWYTRLEKWTSDWARKTVVLEYEQLVANVNDIFPKLCIELELPSPPVPIIYPPQENHNVMGNAPSFMGDRYKQRSIIPDERWRMELPDSLKKLAKNHARCQRVWRELQRKAVR